MRYSASRREETPTDYDTDILAEFDGIEGLENGDPGSERTLWEIPSPQANDGAIVFSPEDGYLYTSIDDGSDADDIGPSHVDDWYGINDGGNGQDITENLLSSVHRLNVDSQGDIEPYGIPEDNPWVVSGSCRFPVN